MPNKVMVRHKTQFSQLYDHKVDVKQRTFGTPNNI